MERPRKEENDGAHSSAPGLPNAGPIVDRVGLLARVGGSVVVLREFVAIFRLDWPPLFQELGQALESNDCKAVYRAAHTLKGMVTFFDAAAVTELTLHLEQMGASCDCRGALEKHDALKHELHRLQAELDSI
jgi:HPt (histidine-containing phosphotransfer) domain-containing protein